MSEIDWDKLWTENWKKGISLFYCKTCGISFSLEVSEVSKIQKIHNLALNRLNEVIECCEEPSIFWMTGKVFHPDRLEVKKIEDLLSPTTLLFWRLFEAL